MKDAKPIIIYTDGGSRGNPGPAAYAFVLEAPDGSTIEEKVYLGRTTNNVAEYTGLVKALEKARELGGRHVVLHSDSELLVKQMNGQYRVKNEGLRTLYEEAQALVREFASVEIKHVRREFNKHADRLCNEAMDEPSEHLPLPTFAPTKAPPPPPKPAADPLADVRAQAIQLLARHAETWAEGDADDPAPADVWDELWGLLVKAGAVRGR
jgi:ribonuclease HI